jgi:hypothetical protein
MTTCPMHGEASDPGARSRRGSSLELFDRRPEGGGKSEVEEMLGQMERAVWPHRGLSAKKVVREVMKRQPATQEKGWATRPRKEMTIGFCTSCNKDVPVFWCDDCPDWECENCRCCVREETVREAPIIFVFGSNLAGRHGKGAALFARQHHGAIYGQGQGLQGNSYAIPTKDERLRTLPLTRIMDSVDEFLRFARSRPDLSFEVTPIGCGLAGYKPEQIAPLFKDAPPNCQLPESFVAVLTPPK